jgi:hypothetical protein
MMLLLAIILSLLPAGPQSVATATAPDEPRDLVVSSYYWGRIDAQDIDMSAPFPRSASEEARIRRRRRYNPDEVHIIHRETYALVRNTGSRKIKVVTWDYVFYETAKYEHEIKRFEFRSKETIGPGEMKFLSESVSEGPPSSYGVVVVERIDYDDGTSWQRPGGAVVPDR